MQYVIAATQEHVLSAWRAILAGRDRVEFRRGYGHETAPGCDAVVMAAPLVHDRYGGKPTSTKAQVLVNEKDDGLPRLIIAMPAVLVGERAAGRSESSESEMDESLRILVLKCLEAVDEFNAQHPAEAVTVLEFSIDGMMLPSSRQEQMARAVLEAVRTFEDAA